MINVGSKSFDGLLRIISKKFQGSSMGKRTAFEFFVEIQFEDGWKRLMSFGPARSQQPAQQFVIDYAECFKRSARVVRSTKKIDRANPEGRYERKVVFTAQKPKAAVGKPVNRAA